jgi:uncharacterized membrane protein
MMKAINWKKECLPLLMIAAMIVIGIFTYPSLPERLPIHWNIEGKADGYLLKTPFAAMAIPFLALCIWAMFLAFFGTVISPKATSIMLFGGLIAMLVATAAYSYIIFRKSAGVGSN